MNFFENFLEHLRKPEEETRGKAPEGVCPVCWGYQEYDHKVRKLFKDDQVDVIYHKMKYTRVRGFVKKYIEGIRLREGEVQTCPTCGEAHGPEKH
ncbi:MAG: hypothetical protein M9954_13595 [Cyclobacteriaceae bacterium]|nr:hypothetical protein [Cyclobacteriaceae bacterium]MCB9239164.1 hypothetical protein [Flammeovirgaceae bacterium]MCB0499872.1 hypothetical protein [Cyclobacteriaceae bacterium]MCO5272686.1 hypothetical protein [Cyclobacteriaceae bacterium]MCW5902815.1 hypothetical protein [Cyclobacteriaceae bacterium]